jgi:glycosyltransferase involved in cell wall biosynthesis
MGLRGKFVHLPNFVDLEEQTSSISVNERRIVYSGRLSAEKGLECLLRAIKGLECELYIAGDGPMRKALDALVADLDLCNVRFVGHLSSDKLFDLISSAGIVVVPSDWYENNPYSIIEAFAQAKPVVASRIGGIPELVRDGETGLTFTAGNENDLRIKLRLLLEDPRRAKMMGLKAHEFIVSECNPEQHMKKLVEIYKAAIAISQS